MAALTTVGFLELLVFFFATRFTMILRLDFFFATRFFAGDFYLTICFLETAFFAGFRLAVVLRFTVRFLAGDFFFSVRVLATIFFAAFFTVLGFLVLAFGRRDVVFLVAISHLN